MYSRWRIIFVHLNQYLDTNYVQEESQPLKITKCNGEEQIEMAFFLISLFLVLYDPKHY